MKKSGRVAIYVLVVIIFFLTIPEIVVRVLTPEQFARLSDFTREGANKRGNSSRLTQSFHFFMFEPIFSPVNALNQPI